MSVAAVGSSAYPVLRRNIIRISHSLGLVGAGKGEVHPDYEANGWAIVDLRNWRLGDPSEDAQKLSRLANAVADAIHGGCKVLFVDVEGKDRVSIAAVAALVSNGDSGSAAWSKVRNAHPESFSGMGEKQREKWQQYFERLDPVAVRNVPPAPSPKQTRYDHETFYTNRQGNQS